MCILLWSAANHIAAGGVFGIGFWIKYNTLMTKRPMEFKVDVLRYRQAGHSPKEAFRICCEKYGFEPSGCMTKYASGFIRDYEYEIKAKLFDKDPDVTLYCMQSQIYIFN